MKVQCVNTCKIFGTVPNTLKASHKCLQLFQVSIHILCTFTSMPDFSSTRPTSVCPSLLLFSSFMISAVSWTFLNYSSEVNFFILCPGPHLKTYIFLTFTWPSLTIQILCVSKIIFPILNLLWYKQQHSRQSVTAEGKKTLFSMPSALYFLSVCLNATLTCLFLQKCNHMIHESCFPP